MLATAVIALASATPAPAPTSTPRAGTSDDTSYVHDVWNWLTGGPLRIVLIVVLALVAIVAGGVAIVSLRRK